MKIYRNLLRVVFLGGAILLSSCSDFLDEKGFDFVTKDVIGDDLNAAIMLTNGAIATLNEGQFFEHDMYTKGQEFDSDHIAGGSWAMGGYGSGNFTNDWFVEVMWTGRYALIYRCNKAIDLITAMQGLRPDEEEDRRNCLGQLHFLKAWGYFQLVRAYGPVPLRKDLTDGFHKGRASVADVYDYIISELKLADASLFDRMHRKYELGRISKYAAKTLLAQVYVTMASASLPEGTIVKVFGGKGTEIGDDGKAYRIEKPVQLIHQKKAVAGYNFNSQHFYELARDLCDTIIQYGGYALYKNYLDTWKFENRNGSESIWALQAGLTAKVLTNGTSTSFAGYKDPDKPGFLSGALFGCRQHWYELFDEDDTRVKDGVVHRYAFWSKGGDGPDKNDPWYFFYPMKDSLKAQAEDPYFGYKKTDAASDGHAILRKFEGVSDRSKELSDFHYPFLRYPAVFLMLAEAECELGNFPAAKDALDVVRSRANASLTKGIAELDNKDDLRSFILEERGRELALEGYRKWDLLRWGVYVQVMSAVDIDEYTAVKRRQDRHLLMPIPRAEINSNDSINVNNNGW